MSGQVFFAEIYFIKGRDNNASAWAENKTADSAKVATKSMRDRYFIKTPFNLILL